MSSDELEKRWDDLQTTVRHAADQAKKTVESAADEAQGVAASVSSNVQDGAAAGAIDRSRETLASAGVGVSDAVSGAARSGKAVLRRGGAEAGARIARQPVEAVLLAAVVGYFIGFLLHRRG